MGIKTNKTEITVICSFTIEFHDKNNT